MAKGDWWLKLDINEWLNDPKLRRLRRENRDSWLTACLMMTIEGEYQIRGEGEEIANLLHLTAEEFTAFIDDIKRTNVADVSRAGRRITIVSRRYKKEMSATISNRERQARHREKGGGNPEKWTAIRAVILLRDNKMCAYCGRRATTVDHVIPRAKGGAHDETNLVAACKACNLRKGSRTPAEAGMSFFASFNLSVLQSNIEVTSTSHDKVISHKKEVNKEEEIRGEAEAAPCPRRLRPTATRIPDPFPITPEMWAWLAENKVEIENVNLAHDEWVEYWTNCTTAKAVKPRWDLAWQKGMKKAAQWEAERKANGTNRKNFNGSKPSGGELIANRPYR